MDTHNPFGGGGGGSTTPSSRPLSTTTNPNNLAAARLASMRPTVPSTNNPNPIPQPTAAQYTANPFVNPTNNNNNNNNNLPPPLNTLSALNNKNTPVNTNNPFPVVGQGQPHPQSLTIPSSSSSSYSTSVGNPGNNNNGPYPSLSQPQQSVQPPVKTIQDYVSEYLNGPQITNLAISTVSSTPNIPVQNAPSPFTSLTTYSIGLPVIKNEVLSSSSSTGGTTSTAEIGTSNDQQPIQQPKESITINTLPSLTNVIKALHQQQYGRILTVVPTTASLLTLCTTTVSMMSTGVLDEPSVSSTTLPWDTLLGYVRCRITALFVTKKYATALTEINSILVKLQERIVTFAVLDDPIITTNCSSKYDTNEWTITIDTCCTWLYLYGENLAYNGYWRESVVILHGLVRYFTNRFITPVGTTPSSSRGGASNSNDSIFSSWSTENILVPLRDGTSTSAIPVCEQLLSYLHITVNNKGLPLLGKQRCSYYLTSSAIKCAEILAGVGYTVAARNIYTETLEAYDSLYTSANPTVWTIPNDAKKNSNDINSSLHNIQCVISASPSSLSLPSYVSAVYLSPVSFFHGLLLLSQIQLLRAMNKDTDISSHLESLEAIPYWKGSLSTSPLPTMDQIKALSIMEAYACSLVCQLRATILAQNQRLTEALSVYELALYSCSRTVLNTCTNRPSIEKLTTTTTTDQQHTVHLSSFISSVSYLSPVPDPYDLMNDIITAIVDCVRRGPPAGALPPSSIALDFLHASVRSQPILLGRPGTTIATLLGSLLETSRDPATALLAKRVVQGVAIRYGLNHIDPTVYRLNP